MRRRAEEEKKSEAQLATTMKNIEQTAAAQFNRDKDEELRYRKATLGEWVRLCGAGSVWMPIMWAFVRLVVFGSQYLAPRLPLVHIALLSHHTAS